MIVFWFSKLTRWSAKLAAGLALGLLLTACGQTLLPTTALRTTDTPPPPPVVLPTEPATVEAPTAQPLPTEPAQPTPTETPVVTNTPLPTATATEPLLEILSAANCRGGPGVPYAVELQVKRGRILPILGQSTAFGPLWWKVNVDGVQCWVWNELGRPTGRIESVPTVAAPPTPTPIPTPVVTRTPTPVGIQFAVTLINKTSTNVCFVFIVPASQTGWGKSILPSNFFLPPDGKFSVLLSSGKWNFRAEDCKDDVIEIAVDQAITADTEWEIGP